MSGEREVRVGLELWQDTGSLVMDLDASSILLEETRCLLRAPLTPDVTSGGVAALGMLVSLMDIGAAEPGMVACRPDWTATQDLTVHNTGRWLAEGPVVIDSRLVRAGKNAITVATHVYDGHGVEDFTLLQRGIAGDPDAPRPTLTAKGLVTFARLPRSAAEGMSDYDPLKWMGQIRRRTFDRKPVGSQMERMGAQIRDAANGVVELPRTRYVSNAIGTIFGGAQATLLQFAAEAMRPGLVATDLQLHYLAQIRVGPVRTRGVVSRDASDHSVITLELVDAGYRELVLALATITLQRAPG